MIKLPLPLFIAQSIFEGDLFSSAFLLQFLFLFVGLGSAYLLSSAANKIVHYRLQKALPSKQLNYLNAMLFPLILCLIQWTFVAASHEFHLNALITRAGAVLVTAWATIRFTSLLDFQKNTKKLLVVLIYSIALLHIFGLLNHLLNMMDKIALNIGDLHLSLLSTLKGGLTFSLLLWGTATLSRRAEREMKRAVKIEPTLQALFIKLIRVFLIAFSILIALSSVGLDLSAFAVFGGAIGVGIGFGLQKVVSNLICGIILLLDRSVKPGDVIALDQGKSYGEINRLGARCVSVRTRSGKEHLIPNEDFITYKLENWSLSDSLLRITLPMRASLDADVPLVMDLLIKASEGVDRVLKSPIPCARLSGFSDSAIEFELRVWINDPQNGLSKVQSDIYINIWTLFKKHGITIPHSQNDVHLRTSLDHHPAALSESLPGLLTKFQPNTANQKF